LIDVNRRKLILFSLLAVCIALAAIFRGRMITAAGMIRGRLQKRTVADRLQEFGGSARQRWAKDFQRAGVVYPPKEIILLALKKEKIVRVFAIERDRPVLVRSIAILAASGAIGPKLREGDQQVPEGIYRIESLNPNSSFHVSLRLNYPNNFDLAQARKDGRENLGGDIMIHGNAVSIGCIAVGDEAAEDLFTLASNVGLQNAKVLIAPCDLNVCLEELRPKDWLKELYANLRAEMESLPSK
jgi:hypothetical protein